MSDFDDLTMSDTPVDRLTRLSVEMTAVLELPENADVQAIVFLSDAKSGGIQMHGYDNVADGMAALFVHMKAVFQAMGKDLDFVGIPDSPEGLTQ